MNSLFLRPICYFGLIEIRFGKYLSISSETFGFSSILLPFLLRFQSFQPLLIQCLLPNFPCKIQFYDL